jgi:predicted transcriptional regulator
MNLKERYENRIEELEQFIKNIRSGAIKGDIKEIKKLINKYKKYLEEHPELDKEHSDML